MMKLIYYKIPFLSVLINTISLWYFVFWALDPSLNIEKKIFISKNIQYFICNTSRNILHFFSCFTSIMTWNKFNQINLFQKQPLEVFCEKGVLKNFASITRKHLCWSLSLIRLHASERLQHGCFPVNFVKFLRTSILKNICEWLLLLFV